MGRGFLGRTFARNGWNVLGREAFNIEGTPDPGELIGMRAFRDCDTVINCIGQSHTRYCEAPENWQEVLMINGLFPAFLSAACGIHGKKLVHVSTGCLYAGTGAGLMSEESHIETHCNYTASKLAGELGCDLDADLIIRPRLLFDRVPDPKSLLTKFKTFKWYLNEFNTITSTQVVVDSVTALLKGDCRGVYNVGNTGTYTIAQMAEAFHGLDRVGTLQASDLIQLEGLHLVNNVMDLSKIKAVTGYEAPDALEQIKEYAKELN